MDDMEVRLVRIAVESVVVANAVVIIVVNVVVVVAVALVTVVLVANAVL